jgi:putative endonuclease
MMFPNIKGAVVYVLMCKNGRLYKGFTENFSQRMHAHFHGFGCQTTRRMKPEYVFHYEVCVDRISAIRRERFFKTAEGGAWLKANPVNTLIPKQELATHDH